MAPGMVSRDTWTDGEWPLTVDAGTLTCIDGLHAAFFVDIGEEGRLWPLNGRAKSNHERFGAEPDINPIWRFDPQYADGIRVSIGPMINRALEFCG